MADEDGPPQVIFSTVDHHLRTRNIQNAVSIADL